MLTEPCQSEKKINKGKTEKEKKRKKRSNKENSNKVTSHICKPRQEWQDLSKFAAWSLKWQEQLICNKIHKQEAQGPWCSAWWLAS